jgi:hypothetical protein
MVWGLAVKDADIAMIDVVVDTTDRGEIGKSFGDEFASGVGRGLALVYDLDCEQTGHGVGKAHPSAFVESPGLDVVLGYMLRILPIFLLAVEIRLWREAAPDLSEPRAVG